MWGDGCENVQQVWFFSIFHSISAFCNAGFGLFGDSLVVYSGKWQVYGVIGVLIILGGVGFGVLYDIAGVFADFVRRSVRRLRYPSEVFEPKMRRRVSLQTKLVLVTSLILIIAGMSLILLLENNGNSQHEYRGGGDRVLGALFQSVTARTAGFNTVDISSMSSASRIVLMMLMFIGGSPGSTAGGIKTVTLSVLVMVVYATLRKRGEVEVFGRSVRSSVVGKAITVTVLFAVVFFAVSFALSITERGSGFSTDDLMFETVSALGTVGLSCGITSELTSAGKLIIIATMLIGRLGPLTLLAAMTFNLKPARYSYPDEPIIVG
jgi:trk system potassium uptake protein TrkH